MIHCFSAGRERPIIDNQVKKRIPPGGTEPGTCETLNQATEKNEEEHT